MTRKETPVHLLKAAIFLGLFALVGCASQIALPELAPTNPANPNAPEPPLPQMQTLALDRSSDARTPVSDTQLMPDVQQGMRNGYDMSQMAHDMSEMKHEAPTTLPGENAAPSAPRWTPTTVPATPT